MEHNKLPYVSPELLNYLEKMFPDKLPTTLVSEPESAYLIGQISVVRHLLYLSENQEKRL